MADAAPPPPGTCELHALHGTVLLGGVLGPWFVELTRARNYQETRDWTARVSPPPKETGDGGVGLRSPIDVRPFQPIGADDDLIPVMIAAAQEAHRNLISGDWTSRLADAPGKVPEAESPESLGEAPRFETFEVVRVGERVEIAVEANPMVGRPGWVIRAYDDPSEAVAHALEFLAVARGAQRAAGQ